MRRSEVFTPNTLPQVTFIEDHLLKKKEILQQALEMGGAVIALSGPSKSGKTVFIEKAIGKQNLVQVTGAGIDDAATLWRRVFDVMGTPLPVTKTVASTSESSVSGTLGAAIPFVVKAEGTVSGRGSNATSTVTDEKPDFLNLMVQQLAGTNYVVFIDDFHYIPKPVQTEVANLIKEAIRAGVRFICAAVPYHADDVILANADLRGRMVKLDFDYWKPPELVKIAERGFGALRAKISTAVIEAMAAEAAGSPQLMQGLCLNLCFEKNIELTFAQETPVPADLATVALVCSRAALMTDYSSVIQVMKDGPKTRGTERKSYVLQDRSVLDVYPLILKAVKADPPQLTIRYPDLLKRITTLCYGDAPSGSSVIGACSHMSDLANAAASSIIVEWDATNDVLDIRDPYLLFALRWTDWA